MRIIFLLLFLIISPLTLAEQLIIEPEMGRDPILSAMQHARYSLNIVMYGWTDQTLLNEVIQKKLKNLSIKVILEQHPYKREDENNKTIHILDKNNIPWQGNLPDINLIHQKTILIDNQKALVMTFNFTKSAFKNDRNFALIIDNHKQVKQINSMFASDWNHISNNINSSELFYAPGSRHKIAKLIQQAKKSIHIYAQQISDYQIIGLLAKASRKGIDVNILTSQPIRHRYLQRAGVKIHYSQKYYIHAKVIIIDEQKALLGSTNLTHYSLDQNRELSILTTHPDVIKQLNTTFTQDWHSSRNSE